jgi:hypothetical protein
MSFSSGGGHATGILILPRRTFGSTTQTDTNVCFGCLHSYPNSLLFVRLVRFVWFEWFVRNHANLPGITTEIKARPKVRRYAPFVWFGRQGPAARLVVVIP